MNSHHRRQVPFVLVLLILVGIASAASAQPAVDLTVSDIQVVFSANNWRVLPQITLVALESQATHPLQVRIYLDSDPIETLEGQMMYDPDPSSCYGAPWPTCGGDCPDIHGFLGDLEGVCLGEGFVSCGCSWILDLVGNWYLIGNYDSVTVIVDPDDLVTEIDEDNNQMTLYLNPVRHDAHTWAEIKALYR